MAKVQKSNIDSSQSSPLGNYHLLPGSLWGELKTVIPSKSFKKDKNSGEFLLDEKGQKIRNKAGDIWVENDAIKLLRSHNGIFVNDVFIPLWYEPAQILLLEGSYGSSKTTYALTRLLVHCMEDKFFKCFYGRQDKTMAVQLHSNLIREIERNGWESKFEYSKKPNGTKKIFCLDNGNMFELFGCNDDDTLKGIDNPTHILVDEVNQISFESFGMLVSRLRTSGANLQFIGCFNPCDVYPDHWIVKYLINSNKGESEADIAILEALETLVFKTHHSTYLQNHFQNPDAYYQRLVMQAGGDSERVKDYALGRYGRKLNAKPYYKQFDSDRHVVQFDETNLVPGYTPRLELNFSFDENVQPYLPAILAQEHLVYEKETQDDGTEIEVLWKELWVIDEITAENPNNSLFAVCPMVEESYQSHTSGMNIMGDATSQKEDTKLEKGQNFFTIAQGLLKKFNPILKISDANPNNKTRGDFINMIFKDEVYHLRIKVSSYCMKLIEDLQNTMEALDDKGARTGKKDKSTSLVKGVRQVQKYGHLCDALDYLICELWMEEYILFQNDGISNDPSGGKRSVRNTDALEENRAKNRRGNVQPNQEEDIPSYKRRSRNSAW